jgi:hypothetical protein
MLMLVDIKLYCMSYEAVVWLSRRYIILHHFQNPQAKEKTQRPSAKKFKLENNPISRFLYVNRIVDSLDRFVSSHG